jgi:malate dehydrogenase (oxaloacetate-decarboxylating)
MDEAGVFPHEAADVAMQAIKEGLARVEMSREGAFAKAEDDITHARELVKLLIDEHFIKQPPQEMLQEALEWTIREVS